MVLLLTCLLTALRVLCTPRNAADTVAFPSATGIHWNTGTGLVSFSAAADSSTGGVACLAALLSMLSGAALERANAAAR